MFGDSTTPPHYLFPFAEVNKNWIWFVRHNSFAVLSYIHYLKLILPDLITETEFLSLLFLLLVFLD